MNNHYAMKSVKR